MLCLGACSYIYNTKWWLSWWVILVITPLLIGPANIGASSYSPMFRHVWIISSVGVSLPTIRISYYF